MTTATAQCMFCGCTYEDPKGITRFPICLDCHGDKWDMSACPDGHEHDWAFHGHASFKGDTSLLKVGECRRCGVTYLMPS